jgi:hypothetical protein
MKLIFFINLYTVSPNLSSSFILKMSISWLIIYLLLYVPLKSISLMWRRHHYRWRATKFRPILGVQGLWEGRDLYRATPAVTRGLGFFSRSHPKDRPIQSPFTTHKGMWRIYSNPDPHGSPISRFLRYKRECGGPILTRIKAWSM